MSRRSRTGVETFRELVFRFDVWPVVDEVFEAGVTHVEAKVNSIGDSFLVNGAFPNCCALLGKAFSGLFNKLEIDVAIDNFSAILGEVGPPLFQLFLCPRGVLELFGGSGQAT